MWAFFSSKKAFELLILSQSIAEIASESQWGHLLGSWVCDLPSDLKVAARSGRLLTSKTKACVIVCIGQCPQLTRQRKSEEVDAWIMSLEGQVDAMQLLGQCESWLSSVCEALQQEEYLSPGQRVTLARIGSTVRSNFREHAKQKPPKVESMLCRQHGHGDLFHEPTACCSFVAGNFLDV